MNTSTNGNGNGLQDDMIADLLATLDEARQAGRTRTDHAIHALAVLLPYAVQQLAAR
jgi:hypothetical protein